MTDKTLKPWSALSDDAQGILELLENPYSGRPNQIIVRLGEKARFFDPLTQRSMTSRGPIESELFREIADYVSQDDETREFETTVSNCGLSISIVPREDDVTPAPGA